MAVSDEENIRRIIDRANRMLKQSRTLRDMAVALHKESDDLKKESDDIRRSVPPRKRRRT
jgi:hypothetical protein